MTDLNTYAVIGLHSTAIAGDAYDTRLGKVGGYIAIAEDRRGEVHSSVARMGRNATNMIPLPDIVRKWHSQRMGFRRFGN